MLSFMMLLFVLAASNGSCPPEELISPTCMCRDIFGDSMMVCSNLINAEALVVPIRSTVASGHTLFSLAISDSSLLYIPHNLLNGTKIQYIRLENSQLMSLSDTDVAFEGLEDTLLELRATTAHYVSAWDWQQLRNLKKLSLIDVHHIVMGSVPEPFPELKELSALGISASEIAHIADYAFANLPKLQILVLKDNYIRQLARNMFPMPANELITLDLSDNELETLPKDIFNAMPNLKNVFLDNNRFTTVNEDVFKEPFQSLSTLSFNAGMLLLFIIFTCVCGCWGACPPAESIAPACICVDMRVDSMMTCSNLFNAEELVSPIRSLEMSKQKIFSLEINNSSLLYIPHALFKGTKIEKIRFVNTEIMSLSDSEFAFEGLEETLIEIRATGAHYIAQWNWQQLRHLKNLQLIDVNFISMGSVAEPLPELKELTALGIIRAEIGYIVEGAFANLTRLTILSLKKNYISEVARSMLPEPANELRIIDLSENQIWTLPKDFFNSIPNLSNVYLNNNKFITLQEDIFEFLIQKLQVLTLQGNKLRCDCRMRWLVGRRRPYEFIGTCAEPPSLAGKNLRSLDFKELWC